MRTPTRHLAFPIARPGEAHPGIRVTRRCAIQASAVGLLGLGFNHLSAWPENLAATIYEALGLLRWVTWADTTGRPHFLYEANPIPGLG